MLLNRSFSYSTFTETSLNQLIETAKKEKYYELHEELFLQLRKEVSHSLDHDLTVFRPEITELLEEEIISRYFYEAGAIAFGLKDDEQLLKALEILGNQSEYNRILSRGAAMTTSPDKITGTGISSARFSVSEPGESV